MDCNFHVGQRVVCVDAGPPTRHGRMNGLAEGAMYTIRAVGVMPSWYTSRYPGSDTATVWLSEIIRPIEGTERSEVGYRASRFRPLIETDISIFTTMLNPTPEQVREYEDV